VKQSRIRKRSLAKWALVATIALLACRYVVYSAPLPLVSSWWNATNFDWGDPLHKRARIADRLISTRALIGKSKADISRMLGDPPPTDYFREWDMVYTLGAERGLFSIDSEWLVIQLDNSGAAADAAIVTD